MRCPEERALGYAATVVVAAIVLAIAMAAVLHALLGVRVPL
jgi:hypothetical protein